MLKRRHVRVTIGSVATGSGLVINDIDQRNEPQLRVDFDVKKLQGGAPNLAVVRIYNLSPERRNAIEKEYSKIILEYAEDINGPGGISVIYIGQLVNVITAKESGTDIVTTLFCGSGINAYQNATVHLTVEAGSLVREVIGQVVKDVENFGTEIGVIDKSITGDVGSRGKTFSGTVRDVMNDVLRNSGYSWSINDDVLEVKSDVTETKERLLITPANGLIGSVKRTTVGFDFTTVLNPALRPGQTVGVFSEFVDSSEASLHFLKVRSDSGGRVRIMSLNHKGSNRGEAVTSVVGIR